MFDNRKIVNGILGLIVIGAVAFPFVPMSKDTFLAGKYKTIKIGSYQIYAKIGLRENNERSSMEGFSYFEYSEEQLLKDNCLLKVSIEIDDHDINSSKSRAAGGNFSCLSSEESCTYKNEGMGRLSLYFYNAPIHSQTYIFSLVSKNGQLNTLCDGTNSITHKIRYRRSSWWERAMSV